MATSVTIDMILTDAEISRAVHIFKNDSKNFHKRCVEELVKPNMERINKSLGQLNDPDYIAYAIEYVMMKSSR